MDIIRKHVTKDNIKVSSNEFHFEERPLDFNFPKILLSTRRIKKFIRSPTIEHFQNQQRNDYIRNMIELFYIIICNTERKVLLEFPHFKRYESQTSKLKKNSKEFCARLVSSHIAHLIANRRAEWIHSFHYYYHTIKDLAKELFAKEELSNDSDKKSALLGLNCHQRGIEPFFSRNSF